MENNPSVLAEKIISAHQNKEKIVFSGKLSVLKKAFEILKKEGHLDLDKATKKE